MKTTDNHTLEEINRLKNPATSTMIDRYAIADYWTKGQKVLDAATGRGYGAMILYSLGAKSVTGIDIDEDSIKESQSRFGRDNVHFLTCDIFNLKDEFEENEFDVCTSIETFEHLPPEKIDQYLQSLKFVTEKTIIITTPRRLTPTWEYDGGTHLYEYDSKEMIEILTKNFPDSKISGFGLQELLLNSRNQYGTDITNDLNNCRVFFFVINLKK